MATLRYDPFRKWGWIRWGLATRQPQGSIEEFQAPDESVLAVTGRHPIVLAPTVVICCVFVTIGLQTGIRVAVIPLAIAFLAWRIWQWRVTCAVLTDRRLLSLDGIVYTSVKGLPLALVLDATYRQSVAGRLLGYGNLTLTLEGEGQRTLKKLSRPDTLCFSILTLIAVRDARNVT